MEVMEGCESSAKDDGGGGLKGKSCKGCLYYSSILKSKSRTPLCLGISGALQQELPKTMLEPPMNNEIEWYGGMVAYFGECNGHVHLNKSYGYPILTSLDVLETEEDYARWKVKYHVNLEPLPAEYFYEVVDYDFYGNVQIMGLSVLFVEDNSDDDNGSATSKLVIQIEENTIFYDLKEMSFKDFENL